MARRLIIAHDLGTSGDKASLHDASGRLIAAHTEHYPVDFGVGGRAEQDPDAWWEAFCRANRALLHEADVEASDVACVAMSGQMMGLVLVDDEDRPLRPAIIWADTRAQAERDVLVERVGLAHAYDVMGHRLDATYSLPKAMWVREHEPDVWARTTGLLLAKDFITLRLTGRRLTDPSDASGTNAWDQRSQAWSADLLAAAEVDIRLLPTVVASTTVADGMTPDAAAATGLIAGTPVVVGGGDGACAALGSGLISRGSGANATLGSSSWIQVASDELLRDPRMRFMAFDHVIPGRVAATGTMQAGGASLDWVAGVLGVTGAGDLDALLAAAGEVEAAAEGLYFLPYLLGERSPIWDPSVRGTFLGVSHHHGRAHLARAVLEGVAFNMATILFALREVAGTIDVVDAIGGGARSGTWLRIMADIWGVTIRRRSLTDEANSLGAAVVGGIGVGLIEDWDVAAGLSHVTEVIEPVDAAHHNGLKQHARFVNAYEIVSRWYRYGVSSADATGPSSAPQETPRRTTA